MQYLEQLRQVIGLRSYGQKDPLLEFRKESFQLFEELLFKVKSETVKFLFNLNVIIEKKEKKIFHLKKNKKYQEMILVLVDREKNTNIVAEEQLKY